MRELSEAPDNLSNVNVEERHRLLETAIKRENERLPASSPPIQIIDSTDFLNHLNNINIDQRFHSSRYQLIVKSEAHYIVFDIDKRDGKKSLIALDAANDIRGLLLGHKAERNNYNIIFLSGCSWDPSSNLQKDQESCSLFAFDHCVQLSHADPEFHTQIAKKASKSHTLAWDELPPNFIWNAQSTEILEKYQKKMQDNPALDEVMHNGLSYRQYIALGVCTYPIIEGLLVTRNESVNIHTLKEMRGELNLEEREAELTRLKLDTNTQVALKKQIKQTNQLIDESSPIEIESNRITPQEKFPDEILEIPSDTLIDDKHNKLDEFQRLKRSLVALKVHPDDTQMDYFLAECDQAIKGKIMEEIDHQIAKMNEVIIGLNAPENKEIKALIREFDTGNRFWTTGMDRDARKIETSLMNVPIEERANLLQSSHSSVTSLLEVIVSHSKSTSTKTTNEKGQVIAGNAANSFNAFLEKFSPEIAARKDGTLEEKKEINPGLNLKQK